MEDVADEAEGRSEPKKQGEETEHLVEEEAVPWHSVLLRESVVSDFLVLLLGLSRGEALDLVSLEPFAQGGGSNSMVVPCSDGLSS